MTRFPRILCKSTLSQASRARESLRSFTTIHSNNQPAKDREHPKHRVGGATGYHELLAKPPMFELRCERCHGHRSVAYHNKHFRDPVAFPRNGICSRRRTNCAAAKTRCQTSYAGLPVIHELPAGEATDRLAF